MRVIEEAGSINIETGAMMVKISAAGDIIDLRDIARRKSIIAGEPAQKFMKIRKGGKDYGLSTINLSDGLLTAHFEGCDITITFAVITSSMDVALEMRTVSTHDFEYLEFLRLPVRLTSNIASLLNVVYDDQNSVGVLAATPQTEACIVEYLGGGYGVVVGARYWPAVSTGKVKAVAFGCDTRRLMSTIEAIEVEHGLPHPTIDGEWSKSSADLHKGYLFCDLKMDNLEEAVGFTKQAGLTYILILSKSWNSSVGSYPINSNNFPGGIRDLKKAVDKIHAHGLKAGMHCLTAGIADHDQYLRPMPDPRLHTKDEFVLTEGIDAKSSSIPLLLEKHIEVDLEEQKTERVMRVEDELISCSGIPEIRPGDGLSLSCRRGSYGTTPGAHLKGVKAKALSRIYNMFMPDPKSSLIDEIAERLAFIYNTCGFDMIYFDGGETMMATGPGWYTMGLLHEAFYKKIDGEILWQGSGTPHYSWHYVTRLTCHDAVYLDPKAYCDQRKALLIKTYYRPNLITPDLGWWGFYSHAVSHYATVPDDINYLCAKAVGWDGAIGLQANIEALRSNGRTTEILEQAAVWQNLQHQGYFTDAIKSRLRESNMDFRLVRGDVTDTWQVQPLRYLPDFVAVSNSSSSKQRFVHLSSDNSPVEFSIRALTKLSAPGASGNIILFNPKFEASALTLSYNPDIVKAEVDVRNDEHVEGGKAFRIYAELKVKKDHVYLKMDKKFKKPLDLRQHRIPGIWIMGDGSRALINLQLEDLRGKFRDHYIDIDFSGWRYIALQMPETRRVWDYDWQYNKEFSLRDFDYSNVGAVNIYLNEIAPGAKHCVLIGMIEALRETETILTEPSLTINGTQLKSAVVMQPDEYLECNEYGACRHFSPSGHLLATETLSEISMEGALTGRVSFHKGDNLVSFSSRREGRALISLRVKGKLLE